MASLILVWTAIVLLFAYFVLIAYCQNGIKRLKQQSMAFIKSKPAFTEFIRISVIIPFRNESNFLPELLQSLHSLKYPTEWYEVIFVNDHSEDESCSIVEFNTKGNIKLLHLPDNQLGKKAALSAGIDSAVGDVIATTDADSTIPAEWLNEANIFFSNRDCDLLIGPVQIQHSPGIKATFQRHEFLSLQALTAGYAGNNRPILCNGANLFFRKSTYLELGGNAGHNHLASGDDLFLLKKMRQAGKKIEMLDNPHAIVKTRPVKGLKSLLDQRIRWASKISALNDWRLTFVGLVGLSMAILTLLLPALVVFLKLNPLLFVTFIAVKFILDYWLLSRTAGLYGEDLNVISSFISFLIHPFYLLLTGIGGLIYRPMWKGRVIRTVS